MSIIGYINGNDTIFEVGDNVAFKNIEQPMTVTKVTPHYFDITEISCIYQLPNGTMNILSHIDCTAVRKLNAN